MNNKNNDFKQFHIMNNVYSKSIPKYNNVIWNSIDVADESLIKYINSKIFDVYNGKLNLINNLLYSNEPLPINSKQDVIKFFNIISPLNNEFNFGSYNWNTKNVENDSSNLLFIQNSIAKADLNKYIYDKYINPIKNILTMSNIKFKYFELKAGRYYKNIDIIFVIS